MKIRALTFALPLLASFQICCPNPVTTSHVKVVDEQGEPMAGVSVGVTHSLRASGDNVSGKGITDQDGHYSFTGPSHSKYYVGAEADGYYESRYQGQAYLVENNETIYQDRSVSLKLKEIKKPIPMYARSRVSLKVPEYNKELGFDCEEADWVAPFGRGRKADLFFKVAGYYNERDDRDTTLTISFPREGDGLIGFSGDSRYGSRLVSAHEAPENGYTPRKEWRKARIPTEEANEVGQRFERHEDYQEDLNYYLRVQTVLDPDGNVLSAKYAKIYGDLKFDGVWDKESYIIIEALYFNPITNDRNLEYDVGRNLFNNLKSFEDPRLP